MEQVVEVDDAAMEKYLEEGAVDPTTLHGPLEKALREEDPTRRDGGAALRCWNLLGIVHKHQGRLPEAARAYARASALLRLHVPRDAGARAALLHNLAGLDFSRGRYRSAEGLARRGLALRRRCAGTGIEPNTG